MQLQQYSVVKNATIVVRLVENERPGLLGETIAPVKSIGSRKPDYVVARHLKEAIDVLG
jgi:hypothetical protein